MRIVAAALSHVGLKRLENQDRFAIHPASLDNGPWRLVAVADGMGGEAAGGLAAQTAMDELELLDFSSLYEGDATKTLVSWATQANAALLRMGRSIQGLEGMGATFTVAALCNNAVHWLHVGDSRLYLFRNRRLRRITRDHRFLQPLLDSGSMAPAEAAQHPMRNRLDQCLGCPQFKPDTGSFACRPRDVLLLCSDGLHDQTPEESIAAILDALPASPREPDLEETALALVQAALRQGGRDNITVVLACVQG